MRGGTRWAVDAGLGGSRYGPWGCVCAACSEERVNLVSVPIRDRDLGCV